MDESTEVERRKGPMTIYYGVVHQNRVEMEGEAHLEEGLRVEIHTSPANTSSDRAAIPGEEAVWRRLRAAGLLTMPLVLADEATSEDDEAEAFEPIVVQGESLSEQIIRERR